MNRQTSPSRPVGHAETITIMPVASNGFGHSVTIANLPSRS